MRPTTQREGSERLSDSVIHALLAASLDYESSLRGLAGAAVPAFADACLVHVLDEDGAIRAVAGGEAPDPELDERVARVIRSGERETGADFIVLPLPGRERTLGAISFVRARGDLEEAEEITTRAATLVDNARLYSELRRSRDQLRIILDGVTDGILVHDRRGGFVFANESAAIACGFATVEELVSTPPAEVAARFELLDEQGVPIPHEAVPSRLVLQGAPSAEQVMRWRFRESDEERWSVTKARPVLDERGEILYVITIFTDITALRAAEQERSARKFRAIVESAPDALLGVDASGLIAVANEQAETLFGYAREELLGHPLEMLWAKANGAGHTGLRKDGSEFPAEVSVSPLDGDDQPLGIAIVRDVTERRRAEERIAHLAFHDGLTGLPNRSMLEGHLEMALGRARRGGQSVALLYIDLDEFKLVNDSLGHIAGDELLRQVARRLGALKRESDLLARQGGDEFLLLVPDLDCSDHAGSAPSAVARIAERIHWALRDPFVVEGLECRLGASVGVSIYPHDAGDAPGLLRHADAALYNGKALGRGTTVIYADDEADPLERLSLTTRLRRAVERGEFVLHYQPVVDLEDGSIAGVEALVRWDDPERGIIAPREFIAAAEGLGLIERIGDWVFEEACRQAREWRRAGGVLHVSINLSLRQVWQSDLTEKLLARVHRAGLSPDRFILEITESTAMTGSVRGEQTLQALADAGFRLAIDDFGTGYSSLARLKGMPVEILKIDRSFVSDADTEDSSKGIVKTIVELSHNLGLSPIAEGIETPGQWRALRDHGCRLGQGYLFSRPVPADEVPVGAVALPA
jgi:diguanylate cyclase (GGDEF)-like protein/PAS domain S-box-containing protein